jgi:hypothetical protein
MSISSQVLSRGKASTIVAWHAVCVMFAIQISGGQSNCGTFLIERDVRNKIEKHCQLAPWECYFIVVCVPSVWWPGNSHHLDKAFVMAGG